MTGKFISMSTSEGRAVEYGESSITPISKSLVIRFPFGGYILNRPTAIKVVQGNEEEMIPVIDVSRIALGALMSLTVFFWLISWRIARGRRGS